jgi:hypothetical protein
MCISRERESRRYLNRIFKNSVLFQTAFPPLEMEVPSSGEPSLSIGSLPFGPTFLRPPPPLSSLCSIKPPSPILSVLFNYLLFFPSLPPYLFVPPFLGRLTLCPCSSHSCDRLDAQCTHSSSPRSLSLSLSLSLGSHLVANCPSITPSFYRPRSPSSSSFSPHFLLSFRLFCVSLTVSQARWVSRESANSPQGQTSF